MTETIASRRTIPVFDIGNVLIEWDPRHLYRQIFEDEGAIERFLATVCTQAWNEEQDRGRSFEEGVRLLIERFPEHEAAIRAYDERWHEMVPGAIERSVAVLGALRRAGIPTYAITNFSAEKFASAQARFPFLAGFDGIVVSAHEGVLKPEPAIYRLLLDRHGLAADDCIFIDDSVKNVEGARRVGMKAIHFTGPDVLVREFRALGLPVA
ncbi:HAD family hydrolase [Labrys wisconsinensis]|uniref:2-haloacid dehalogenase n=1 Tax=Labrys wisconsinensis TaxID=425677 RepID=A0ABU0JD77_9HYPH|nr:HAD family phosphatase [Labrys wisconsinensis]MDQ0472239.1 2-haloacid dehalogenase [Labrys wisconsinensis]